jgi:hypothetical protein
MPPVGTGRDWSYSRWGGRTTGGTTNHYVARHVAWLTVRPCKTSRATTQDLSTLWNRRLEILNMNIDLVTVGFGFAITHELGRPAVWYCPRFQHFLVVPRSWLCSCCIVSNLNVITLIPPSFQYIEAISISCFSPYFADWYLFRVVAMLVSRSSFHLQHIGNINGVQE